MSADPANTPIPRIIGTGHRAAAHVRTNDDPVFDYLRAHPVPGKDLFQGFRERRVLPPDQGLIDLMAPAAEQALAGAGCVAGDVDMLLGCGSISEFVLPNALSEVHQRLGLDRRAWPIALMNSFSQVPAALMMADALIRAERAETILLAFGDNWTRHVSYSTPQSISASDGAAALVVRRSSDPNGWRLVDQHCDADTSYFGAMYMAPRAIDGAVAPSDWHLPNEHAVSQAFFQIEPAGIEGFQSFGVRRAPEAVLTLLARHGIASADICLITHQASSVLMDHWRDVIGPGHYVNSLDTYANMVLCSVPFNLSLWLESGEVEQDWLVTLCLGPDMHANAMLFRRGA